MKEGIHPEYRRARVVCACGNTFETRATRPEIRIEICSNCHPFFTGKQKLIDTERRVERFKQKYERYEQQAAQRRAAAAKTSKS
ncbi:MAG: 50S ribosomal protein L31 [Armatimonadota bacterium]|nr:MAG: 50S ribosomal protein L31 [Armatimonadota bacterium]